MPEKATPVIYNLHVPNYDALNKFMPHDPKKTGIKKVKTEEEKKRDFQTYCVAPTHFMNEEDCMVEDLFDDTPQSLLDEFGLQKAVPMTIKEIRQLDTTKKKNGLMQHLKK